MIQLTTILGTEIPVNTRGILYLCELKEQLEIFREILFEDSFEAIQAYSNIPNPASQIITGETYDELIKDHLKF